MPFFVKLCDALAHVSAALAGLCLGLLVLLDGSEIVLRSFFATSLPFVVEYNGYLLAVVLLGGCAQALNEGAHIRVTMLPQALSAHAAKALDVGCTVAGIGLAFYLCAAVTILAYGSFQYGTVSFYGTATPLVYPQAAGALMLGIFVLSLIARLVRLLLGLEPHRPAAAIDEAH